MRLPPPSLGGAHLPLVHPEVTGYLMPDRVLDEPRALAGRSGEALVRTLKNDDSVGHRESIEDTPGASTLVD